MTYGCPVCGFLQLTDPPRTPSGGGSYEICPSCGFQFGVSDDDQGWTYDKWRSRWIKEGMRWDRGRTEPPLAWNPIDQLARIGACPGQVG